MRPFGDALLESSLAEESPSITDADSSTTSTSWLERILVLKMRSEVSPLEITISCVVSVRIPIAPLCVLISILQPPGNLLELKPAIPSPRTLQFQFRLPSPK